MDTRLAEGGFVLFHDKFEGDALGAPRYDPPPWDAHALGMRWVNESPLFFANGAALKVETATTDRHARMWWRASFPADVRTVLFGTRFGVTEAVPPDVTITTQLAAHLGDRSFLDRVRFASTPDEWQADAGGAGEERWETLLDRPLFRPYPHDPSTAREPQWHALRIGMVVDHAQEPPAASAQDLCVDEVDLQPSVSGWALREVATEPALMPALEFSVSIDRPSEEVRVVLFFDELWSICR
jgi:hypothetical protein